MSRVSQMTKKHYVKIAEWLVWYFETRPTDRGATKKLAAIFENDNPRFNEKRFNETVFSRREII